MLDYIGVIDVKGPENLSSFLNIFNTGIFEIVPNPFRQEKFEDLGLEFEPGVGEMKDGRE